MGRNSGISDCCSGAGKFHVCCSCAFERQRLNANPESIAEKLWKASELSCVKEWVTFFLIAESERSKAAASQVCSKLRDSAQAWAA
jgi:hypothetical protein